MDGATKFPLIAIPLFVLMARFLSDSGVTDRMFETLRLLMAKVTGGLGLAVVFISILLAATTGIIGASITVMGVMALKPMLQYGYSKRLTTGVIAASGCLGILIPPSIMLVIMSDQLAISLGDLFMGALFPGLILGALYIAFIVIYFAVFGAGVAYILRLMHKTPDPVETTPETGPGPTRAAGITPQQQILTDKGHVAPQAE